MTVFNANRCKRTGIGLAIGLLAGFSAANAASPAPQGSFVPTFVAQVASATAPTPSNDPAKQLPGTVSVANIDFKRGDGGSGKLILRFSGDGAAPDLRTTGSTITINVGNAQLPAHLQKPLNVTDFATPVQSIDARAAGNGSQLVLNTNGAFESMAYQTGRDYIVEISPRAAGARRAVGASTSSSSAAGATPRYAGRPVTFNFQDVPVRTVLQLIAEESGLNIVAADTVVGNVTLRLVNVPWDQALDIVMQAKGLDKRRSGNVVWVAPQSEIAKYEQDKEDARIALDSRADLVTEYIQINYHNAGEIFKALTEAKGIGGGGQGGGNQGNNQNSSNDNGFLSTRGRLVADERTNTLMVSDIPKKVAQIRELVHVIDRPVDQVIIEARIVIATETFSRELGARFGFSGQRDHALASGSLDSNHNYMNGLASNAEATATYNNALAAWIANGRTGTAPTAPTLRTPSWLFPAGYNVNLPVTNPAGALALTILNAGHILDLELSAMQEEGRGEVISNPRVVTSNQREAVIRQGQEVGYVTLTNQAGGQSQQTVQFKDVLLELKVTPTITNDGRVFLNMNVKKDEVEGFVQASIGQVPLINKREVNTAVLIEDGQTVVIGGVYEFRDRSDVQKVPFLGDIPFLGNFFRKKGKSKDKAELLIFVTPKVLQVAQR
ncbi:type IV pilus secretin PilQ [Lysobacter fragariae]